MIKGIDTQIMITRAADLARDASSIQRHPQAAQENLAARNLTESSENLTRIQESTETEMNNIRTDAEGGGSGAAGGGGSNEEEEEEEMTEEQEKELLVAPAAHEQIIDIMV